MATPGSWIGKTPAVSTSTKQETDSSETKKSEETMSSVIERLETRLGIRESKPAKRPTSRTTSKEGSATTRTSPPKKTRNSSRSSGRSSEAKSEITHAIHKNIKTGIFWCDCDGFKSYIETDAKHHMEQNKPKKKPFVRKEHLTNRPFQGNEALQALRDSLPEAEKFNPGKKPRNKENN